MHGAWLQSQVGNDKQSFKHEEGGSVRGMEQWTRMEQNTK